MAFEQVTLRTAPRGAVRIVRFAGASGKFRDEDPHVSAVTSAGACDKAVGRVIPARGP